MSMEAFAPKNTETSVENAASHLDAAKSFDFDKRIDVSKAADTFNAFDKGYDPDARIDINVQEKEKSVSEEYDPDKRVEVENSEDEKIKVNELDLPEKQIVNELGETDTLEKKGGSYKEVYKKGEGDTYEDHHMPADSASFLEFNDGPVIKMEKEDHRLTASCGSSREAREYCAKQKELIEQGKFREAIQMDIDDIREKFEDKYDDAIAEMMEYVDKLEEEGKI